MGERQRAKARGKKKFMLEMIFQLGLKGRRGGGERESGERERKYGRTGIMVLAGESREGKGETWSMPGPILTVDCLERVAAATSVGSTCACVRVYVCACVCVCVCACVCDCVCVCVYNMYTYIHIHYDEQWIAESELLRLSPL